MRPFLVSLVVVLLSGGRARADAGAWLWTDLRVPVWTRHGLWPRVGFRIATDTRLMAVTDTPAPGTSLLPDPDGLVEQYVRPGVVFWPTRWLMVPVNAVFRASVGPEDHFVQQLRLEIEPTFDFRLGPVVIIDRNRLEYDWTDGVVTTRYRNRLWINFAPRSWPVIPFVWNEFFLQIPGGFNQNRFSTGLGIPFMATMRIDLMYMRQSRRLPDGSWPSNNVAIVQLIIDWPVKQKK